MKTHAEFLEELKDYVQSIAIPDCEKAFSYYEGEKHLNSILSKIEQFEAKQKQVKDEQTI
jgi:hypothetical protein